MPTAFPNSPKLAKGAFLEYRDKSRGAKPNQIDFQYNPEKLTRKLNISKTREGKGKGKESFKTASPPEQTISITIIIDATDRLEKMDGNMDYKGIYPQLSALEKLLYADTSQMLGTNSNNKDKGTEKVTPLELPVVLFVWGLSRVLPVNITGISVTEQAFDTKLNPIRAELNVNMNVLTWDDLMKDEFVYEIYLENVKKIEKMAQDSKKSQMSSS